MREIKKKSAGILSEDLRIYNGDLKANIKKNSYNFYKIYLNKFILIK